MDLVFDWVKGHVSHELHASLYTGFHTVNEYGINPLWYVKSGFISQIGKFGKTYYKESKTKGGKPQREIKAKVK